MKNIDQIKEIAKVFYTIKRGITLQEVYNLCNDSTKEEVDAKITELEKAKEIKIVENKVIPFETL